MKTKNNAVLCIITLILITSVLTVADRVLAQPTITVQERYLAQDGFPEIGFVYFEDLGVNNVRFDMANNISPAAHERNDPGDTIVVEIVPASGRDFDGDPELFYNLHRNPVFTSAHRTAGLPDQGSVVGYPAFLVGHPPSSTRWAFDLPDEGFLFPGDVLHYYISATDAVGGVGGADPETSLMPPDITDIEKFDETSVYSQSFTVRALPTVWEEFGEYVQPPILLWYDGAGSGGLDEWLASLLSKGHYLVPIRKPLTA